MANGGRLGDALGPVLRVCTRGWGRARGMRRSSAPAGCAASYGHA